MIETIPPTMPANPELPAPVPLPKPAAKRAPRPRPRLRVSRPRARTKPNPQGVRTLAIDIGGTGIKTMLLSPNGKPLSKRTRVRTPRPATPAAVLKTVVALAAIQGKFDRVSVGFPGVVRHGVAMTAPHLGHNWRGYKLAEVLSKKLGKPTRVVNDADLQGYGVISGEGVELLVTLGTGFGAGLFVDGTLVPNLEIAHHPFRKGKTYDETLGNTARRKLSNKKWNKRLLQAIETLERTFNYDRLYVGGGNVEYVTARLPKNVKLVSNATGLLGGIALWKD